MHQIELNHVCKRIKRDDVLVDINLSMNSGNIYGFTGRNGSGKSMLLRILSGLISPTAGEICMNGMVWDGRPSGAGRIGVLIENAELYRELTGIENLKYLAGFQNVISIKDIETAMLRVGLAPDDKRTVKKYSLGMKQRLAIAQAIMEKPDFLYLDEPTNALDENGVIMLRNIVKEEYDRGAFIVIASHNPTDIEILCNHVIKLEQGKIISQYEL